MDDRRIAVGELGNRMSPARARDFASRLTAGLQARGAAAGMYDATTDEWPIPPRSAHAEESSPSARHGGMPDGREHRPEA